MFETGSLRSLGLRVLKQLWEQLKGVNQYVNKYVRGALFPHTEIR